uniref:Uncharacterized protein n=1 Tax=Lygus hesperus TaxID=30085 RepID=A0A146LUD2_LYGHE
MEIVVPNRNFDSRFKAFIFFTAFHSIMNIVEYFLSSPKAVSSEPSLGESEMAALDDMRKKLRTYEDEIYKLKAANSDLNMVNKRWHTYNADMQMFVDKLQNTIRDQQEQINNIGTSLFASHPTIRSEDSSECERLDCRNLREDVAKLREEKAHLLLQVKAHKEDWEAEKNEKQEALKERDAIKQRLDSVLRDLCISSTQTAEQRPTTCGCCNVDWEGLVDPERAQASNYSTFQSDSARFSADSLDRDGGYLRPLNIIGSDSEISERCLEDTACALRPKEESYSMVSTVPLSTPPGISPCSSNGSLPEARTFSMGFKSGGTTVTSFVQLPVVKSSSAPDRRSTCFRKPPKFVNSISLSVLPPTRRNIPCEGAETQTDDVTCPTCHMVFTPDVQVKFDEHFESCRANKNPSTSH